MSLQDDVTRLVRLPPEQRRLDDAISPTAIRPQTGLEKMSRGSGEVTTEEVTAISTDGLFTFVVRVAVA
jgi:hypothetical protein